MNSCLFDLFKFWVCKKSIKLNYVSQNMSVPYSTFLWQVEHGSFENIKGTSFISTHTPIQGCIIVFYKYLLLCATEMFIPLFELLFCFITPSCHLRKKGITKYFLTGPPR